MMMMVMMIVMIMVKKFCLTNVLIVKQNRVHRLNYLLQFITIFMSTNREDSAC